MYVMRCTLLNEVEQEQIDHRSEESENMEKKETLTIKYVLKTSTSIMYLCIILCKPTKLSYKLK